MKKTSILAIKLALAVQFFALLSVPVIVASNDAPRAMWMAEWVRPAHAERTIGVLRLRDGTLSFVEQVGQVDWELDLASVKQIVAAGGRVYVTTLRGEEFVLAVMEPNLTPASPKKVVAAIERAVQLFTAAGR